MGGTAPEADALRELGCRIERLALSPDEIRAPWTRLVRPLLRTLGWQPAFEVARLTLLLDALREKGGRAARPLQ